MRSLRPYITLLSFVIILLAGFEIYYLQPAQLNDDVPVSARETNAAGLSHNSDQTKLSWSLSDDPLIRVSPLADSYNGNGALEGRKETTRQQFYQRFSLNWDQFKTDNGMAKVPTASASQSFLLNISSISPDEFSSSLLQNLISNKFFTRFSSIRQLLIRPFFKRFSLLPMASCTAIGAP